MHRLVEAMKHAYAARMSLGDPGKNGEFLDLATLLADLRSPEYAASLRYVWIYKGKTEFYSSCAQT